MAPPLPSPHILNLPHALLQQHHEQAAFKALDERAVSPVEPELEINGTGFG